MKSGLLLLSGLVLSLVAHAADVVKMKNGDIYRGEVLKQDFGQSVQIRFKDGNEKSLPWAGIAKIEKDSAYEEPKEAPPAKTASVAAEPVGTSDSALLNKPRVLGFGTEPYSNISGVPLFFLYHGYMFPIGSMGLEVGGVFEVGMSDISYPDVNLSTNILNIQAGAKVTFHSSLGEGLHFSPSLYLGYNYLETQSPASNATTEPAAVSINAMRLQIVPIGATIRVSSLEIQGGMTVNFNLIGTASAGSHSESVNTFGLGSEFLVRYRY